MPDVLMSFVIAFAPLFSKPVFDHVKVLVIGAILSPHTRTVTNALRVMGLSQEKHFQNYHRAPESGGLGFFAGFTDFARFID